MLLYCKWKTLRKFERMLQTVLFFHLFLSLSLFSKKPFICLKGSTSFKNVTPVHISHSFVLSHNLSIFFLSMNLKNLILHFLHIRGVFSLRFSVKAWRISSSFQTCQQQAFLTLCFHRPWFPFSSDIAGSACQS